MSAGSPGSAEEREGQEVAEGELSAGAQDADGAGQREEEASGRHFPAPKYPPLLLLPLQTLTLFLPLPRL
eukprot:765842-Hanusia_phi.AAC.1